MLLDFNGIGPEFTAVLWSEDCSGTSTIGAKCFLCRLAPTPWQSGSVDHEQGVSKAGNPRLRTTLIQLAWLWLRHQPQSALALWFKERLRATAAVIKDDHSRTGAQAAGGTVEICHRRRRHRRSRDETA